MTHEATGSGSFETIANYLHEIGHLKRVPRSGWSLAGIERPESVADHSHRTAVIAALLARCEGADAGRAALLAVFHDTAECRIGDLHRLARKYVDKEAAEQEASRAQVTALPAQLREWLLDIGGDLQSRGSAEARLVKDADRLECLLQAREYASAGYPTQEWIESSRDELETRSARAIAQAILRGDPQAWSKVHSR